MPPRKQKQQPIVKITRQPIHVESSSSDEVDSSEDDVLNNLVVNVVETQPVNVVENNELDATIQDILNKTDSMTPTNITWSSFDKLLKLQQKLYDMYLILIQKE